MHWPRRSFNRLGMFNNAFRWKSSNYPQLHPLHISFILLIYTRLGKSTAYATKAVGLKMRYNLHSTSSFLMKSWEERRLKFNLTIWFNWGHQHQWRVRDTSGQSRPTYVRGAWRIVNTTSGVGSSLCECSECSECSHLHRSLMQPLVFLFVSFSADWRLIFRFLSGWSTTCMKAASGFCSMFRTSELSPVRACLSRYLSVQESMIMNTKLPKVAKDSICIDMWYDMIL